MNGNSPRLLELSTNNGSSAAAAADVNNSGDYFDADAFDDHLVYRTPRSHHVNSRMSMGTMKVFDPLLQTPQGNRSTHENYAPIPSPKVYTATDGGIQSSSDASPLISVLKEKSPLRQSLDGPLSQSPQRHTPLSNAFVDALKNQELQTQQLLQEKEDEIQYLKTRLSEAYDVIRTLSQTLEETLELADAQIQREKEEKNDMKNRVQSLFK